MIPVVLHHGLLAYGQIKLGRLRISNFRGIRTAIAERGHPVILESVHPTASIDTRARMLKRTIESWLFRMDRPDDRVIVFAHSMGGLDCRHMISNLNMADRVAALVTICTPHRGSPYADWAMKNLGQRLGGYRLAQRLNLDLNALHDLTVAKCEEFNRCTPDMPGVRYYSISASRPWHRVPPFYFHSHKLISRAEGENDGLVSVSSAQWGVHLGTWPVDHLHAINRRLIPEIGDHGTNVAERYLQVLDRVMDDLKSQPTA